MSLDIQGYDLAGRVRFKSTGPLATVSMSEVKRALDNLVFEGRDTYTLAGNVLDESDLRELWTKVSVNWRNGLRSFHKGEAAS